MGEHQHARVQITPEVEDEILLRISEGEPLSRICGPDRRPGMRDRGSVHKRLREDQKFRQAYIIARDAQSATLAEQIIDIADGKRPEDGVEPSVGRDYLRVQARQWLASAMTPRSYVEKGDALRDYEDWFSDKTRLGRQ